MDTGKEQRENITVVWERLFEMSVEIVSQYRNK